MDPVTTQEEISAEIAALSAAYTPGTETQPLLDYLPYRSSALRFPREALHLVDPEAAELVAPVFGASDVEAHEQDLTLSGAIGERMVVTGRVLDGDGRPVAGQLVEIWQANAAGRYLHAGDQHDAPLDPNFTGVGRALTEADGSYRFTTVRPGPYPWKNHHNAWRPAHIHFSLFGTEFTQRLVTQMYFPGDPMLAYDPIVQSIRDDRARDRLVAAYDPDVSVHEWNTGYRWDIVLTGTHATPLEDA